MSTAITKASKSIPPEELSDSEDSQGEATGGGKKTGTIPKKKTDKDKDKGKEKYQLAMDEMLRRIAELEARCERAERKQKQQNNREPRGNNDQPDKSNELPKDPNRTKPGRSRGQPYLQSSSSESEEERDKRDKKRGRQDRDRQRRDSVSTDGYGDRDNRGRFHRRIEHWKLSFSGDSRSISVENFLYKLLKIADREGVSDKHLLRDIHLILEGQASDWFFTYVDEFEDWDDFEERIRYRFGSPNQDQGIRLKIQDRKQQRGETFSAFVSDIERPNKMLSNPLSSRRKFEVVWDNMRHHYRSRIATIRVRDLDHLIRLNHRIDAVDHTLQTGSETRNQRNVNNVDCEDTESGSDQHEDVDAIGTRPEGRNQKQPYRNVTGDKSQKPERTQQNVCWNCRKQGHNWRDCKEEKSVFCYGCGNLGRTIRSCSKCAGSRQQRSKDSQGNQ